MTAYSHERWANLLNRTFDEIQKLAMLKGDEYSGDTDRLLNFRRNAAALGLRKETVWAVYAAKHWDAIMQYVQDLEKGKERNRLESVEGRVDDLLTYLLLFKAMLDEENDSRTDEYKPDDGTALRNEHSTFKGPGAVYPSRGF